MFYIAPEMLNNGALADGRASDVFSLSKTLWKLATGQRYPLPGEHRQAVPALTLSAYVSHPRAELLDVLLEVATTVEPTGRMPMAEFAKELRAWLQLPRIASDRTPDLADLASALREVNRQHVLRQESEGKRRRFIDDHSRRIRNKLEQGALELERLLKSVGMSTSLMLENFHWGFEVYGHQLMVELPDEWSSWSRMIRGCAYRPRTPCRTRMALRSGKKNASSWRQAAEKRPNWQS